jgi:hypothetical protein
MAEKQHDWYEVIKAGVVKDLTKMSGTLASLYEKWEHNRATLDSPIITKNDIPAADREKRLKQLQGKRDEYLTRLVRDQIDLGDYFSITMRQSFGMDEWLILNEVLERDEVNTYALSFTLDEYYQQNNICLNTDLFDKAARVVADYIKTGGKHLVRGSGLPAIS